MVFITNLHRLLLLLSAVCLVTLPAWASPIAFTLEYTFDFRDLDGTETHIMVVNGSFPGPTLTVVQGEEVHITIVNKLPNEALTVHWHGILQHGTPWADGVAHITQCPILPGDSFTHVFTPEEPGTFWYHGHLNLDADTGYGPLIVLPKHQPVPYDEDAGVIMLGNHWHESPFEHMTGLTSVPFRWVGNPQSNLINGQARPPPKKLRPNTTYRLRFTNAAGLTFFTVGISGLPMTIFQTETGLLRPFQSDFLDISNGQSFSVTITTPNMPGYFWLQARVRLRDTDAPPVRMLLHTTESAAGAPRHSMQHFPGVHDVSFSYNFVRRMRSLTREDVAQKADKTWVFAGTQVVTESGQLLWAMNNESLSVSSTPLLLANQYSVSSVLNSTRTHKLGRGETVRIVLQNADTRNMEQEVHPWHVHGYDFRVLGHGEGVYDAMEHEKDLNFRDPVKTSTVTLLPDGWTVVQISGGNPGFWLMHCHIHPHAYMGMGFILEDDAHLIGDVPTDQPICGKVTPRLVIDSVVCKATPSPVVE